MTTNAKPSFEPLALGVADAVRVSGLSRSELYRLMADGRIRAVKHGIRTLIPMDSLRALLDSAPAASFGTKTQDQAPEAEHRGQPGRRDR